MSKELNLQDLYSTKGEKFFKELYNDYRDSFITWSIQSYNLDKQIAIEIFQESVTSLFLGIEQQKISSINCSIKTYLYGIAKHKIYKYFADQKKKSSVEISDTPHIDTSLLSSIELDHTQKMMKRGLATLGERCRKLLIKFYYNRYSTEAIANRMGYENKEVVTSQKYKCIQQLKTWMQKNYKR